MTTTRSVLLAIAVCASLPTTAPADDDDPTVALADALEEQEERLRELAELLADAQATHRRLIVHVRAMVAARGTSYLPVSMVRPGQLRYASLNVRDKVDRALASGAATATPAGYVLRHDGGRSVLPLDAALPVVLGPTGFVLVDGHHDVLASLALGARTVPVKVVADLSPLSVDDFWRTADLRGYVYPYVLGGQWQLPPASFTELVDDPIRYFAAITARKCTKPEQPASESTGADTPLWVKVGKDIPFIEFKIADALFSQGFAYVNEHGDAPPTELVERARDILQAHPVPGLRLVRERTRVADAPDLCAMP